MLLRLLPIFLLAAAFALEVEDDSADPAPLEVADRPRGERADGQLPRPRPRPGGGSGFGSFLSGMKHMWRVAALPGTGIVTVLVHD